MTRGVTVDVSVRYMIMAGRHSGASTRVCMAGAQRTGGRDLGALGAMDGAFSELLGACKNIQC